MRPLFALVLAVGLARGELTPDQWRQDLRFLATQSAIPHMLDIEVHTTAEYFSAHGPALSH